MMQLDFVVLDLIEIVTPKKPRGALCLGACGKHVDNLSGTCRACRMCWCGDCGIRYAPNFGRMQYQKCCDDCARRRLKQTTQISHMIAI